MSVAEELRKTIDELSEDQQQTLLETARQLLKEESVAEEDNPDYQALLKELLMKRYEHHKAHPDHIVSARESNERVKEKYGWS